jgi:hypothetical protein
VREGRQASDLSPSRRRNWKIVGSDLVRPTAVQTVRRTENIGFPPILPVARRWYSVKVPGFGISIEGVSW